MGGDEVDTLSIGNSLGNWIGTWSLGGIYIYIFFFFSLKMGDFFTSYCVPWEHSSR